MPKTRKGNPDESSFRKAIYTFNKLYRGSYIDKPYQLTALT